jgi:hypothetical protein
MMVDGDNRQGQPVAFQLNLAYEATGGHSAVNLGERNLRE